jgi:hypothetical protein
MKALLLSFFAVVLCYSLFFDGEVQPAPADEINDTAIQTGVNDYVQLRDTTTFYAEIASLPWS